MCSCCQHTSATGAPTPSAAAMGPDMTAQRPAITRCHDDARAVLAAWDWRGGDRLKKLPPPLPRRDAACCRGVPAGGTSGAPPHLQPAQLNVDSRSTSRFRACTGDMPSYPDTRKPRASSRALRSA